MIIWYNKTSAEADKIAASACQCSGRAYKVAAGYEPLNDSWTYDMVNTYNIRVEQLTKEKETFLMLKYSGGKCFD